MAFFAIPFIASILGTTAAATSTTTLSTIAAAGIAGHLASRASAKKHQQESPLNSENIRHIIEEAYEQGRAAGQKDAMNEFRKISYERGYHQNMKP